MTKIDSPELATWLAGRPYSSRSSSRVLSRKNMTGGRLVLTASTLKFEAIWRSMNWAVSLCEIASVAAAGERPPRMRVTLKTGDSRVVMVFPEHTRTSIRLAGSDQRDEAIAAVSSAVADVRTTSAPGPVG